MLFFTIVLVGYGGIFDEPVYKMEVFSQANVKIGVPWHQIFLRGILGQFFCFVLSELLPRTSSNWLSTANWLVTLAIFFSTSARDIISKIVALWLPIVCFLAIGADHVITNMFYIPLAIFYGDPQISVGYYIWKSLIPSCLGNIIGGGLFVGVVYWYLYLAGNDVVIHFDNEVVDNDVNESAIQLDWLRKSKELLDVFRIREAVRGVVWRPN